MNAPNTSIFFTADIFAFFHGNSWSTNVVENLATFRGTTHSIFMFVQSDNVPLVLDSPIIVTFFLPPTVYNNIR